MRHAPALMCWSLTLFREEGRGINSRRASEHAPGSCSIAVHSLPTSCSTHPHEIQILTDGSCYKNPGGLSGCAAIVVYPDDVKPEEQIVDIGVAESNISRMELMACNRAMDGCASTALVSA